MKLPDKEEWKCWIFISVMILAIIFGTYYYVFIYRFVLLLVFYWFISIPLILITISSADFISRKMRIKKDYLAIDSVKIQESFKDSTGINPIEKGKMTKPYKQWLIKKVEVPKLKYKYRLRFSPGDFNSLILLIVFLITITIIFLAIYAAIFPDYRVPIVW